MSEDIKKTINELHIYEKKVLKELENNENVTPEEIAQNTSMDIKSVMSAAGSLASKNIIDVKKDVEEVATYEDFVLSPCEFALLIVDCSFATIYAKDQHAIARIYAKAVTAGYENTEYITDENDTRTTLSVF